MCSQFGPWCRMSSPGRGTVVLPWCCGHTHRAVVLRDVLVHIVDVRPHGGDHGGQAGRLGQVGDDLATLHTRIVVLVNQQRLNHN